MQGHKKPLPTINELPGGDQMPKKSSSNKPQQGGNAYQQALSDIVSALSNQALNAQNRPMPGRPNPGQNKNTKANNAPRGRNQSQTRSTGGQSRSRDSTPGRSSRDVSSERKPKTKQQLVMMRYKKAVALYNVAHETMGGHYETRDFLAAAIMLTEKEEKISVIDYLIRHAKVDESYYEKIPTYNPKFVNRKFEFKEQSTKRLFTFLVDQALKEMKSQNFDYNTIMSKATVAALVINRYTGRPEDKNLSFMDYVKIHSHPDHTSKMLQEAHFPKFSKEQRLPHPPGSDPLVKVALQPESSFSTEHFGEPVPDEYRV